MYIPALKSLLWNSQFSQSGAESCEFLYFFHFFFHPQLGGWCYVMMYGVLIN